MQAGKEKFNERKEQIMAIPESEVTFCKMPTEVSTAEAVELSTVAEADKESLLASGIAAFFLEELPIRAAAYLYAAAMFLVVSDTDPEALRQWKELSPRGYEVFRYLKRMMTFAYRDDPERAAAMGRIRDGRGHKDMLLDLLSLHLLATQYPEPLDAIPMFDKSMVDEALPLHEQLSDLYARVSSESPASVQAREMMNRAFTYYKEVADVVKEHGQFIFAGTPRYAAYVSTYRSNRSKAPRIAENETSAEANETSAEAPHAAAV